MPHKTVGWSICMKNSMNIHKIAGVLCALQSVTNLGAKCNRTPPLRPNMNKQHYKREPDFSVYELRLNKNKNSS